MPLAINNSRILKLLCLVLLMTLAVVSHGTQAINNSDLKNQLKIRIADDKRDIQAYIALATIELEQGDLISTEATVKSALRYARKPQSKLELYTLGIILEDRRQDFKAALRYYKRGKRIKGSDHAAALHLAMAKVYLRARNFGDARLLLQQSLAAESMNNEEAETVLASLQRIERALALTNSDFAYEKSISRGEIARLLNRDLGVTRLLGVSAVKSVGETSDQGLTDYTGSVFAEDIIASHRLNLRSFRIRNGAFNPDRQLTRSELALLVEDLLHFKFNISRTSFIGTESPFSDLSSSATGFNAVMSAVTRGLMKGREDGTIGPTDLVSGAEAVLVLHNLNQMLQK